MYCECNLKLWPGSCISKAAIISRRLEYIVSIVANVGKPLLEDVNFSICLQQERVKTNAGNVIDSFLRSILSPRFL